MSARWLPTLAVGAFFLMAGWPTAASADHIVTSATIEGRLKERRSTDFWVVEFRWTANCEGSEAGRTWFDGEIYMIDADTGERIHVGGVGSTSGAKSISGTRETFVSSIERSRRLIPELTMVCYEVGPLHGGREVIVTGSAVVIPQAFGSSGGGGSGGGGGGGGGDSESGDPTAPLSSGGCRAAILGTNGVDRLIGGAASEVIIGFAAPDRLEGKEGHDCLVGGDGNDVLLGQAGADRLTGGRGADLLTGGTGTNAYDAGPGNDVVNARNGRRELIRCGSGRDRAVVDRRDRVRSCERVSRPR